MSASIHRISPAPVLERLVNLMLLKPGDGNNVIDFAAARARLRPAQVQKFELLHDDSIFD